MKTDETETAGDETAATAATKEATVYDQICADLTDRDVWEQRQATWYQIRHDGLRRVNKPWPGAADLHFPLIDGMIEKWKPFYFQQLFATEKLANFVAKPQSSTGSQPSAGPTGGGDLQARADEAAGWFDYKLKQCSNLETEVLVAIDRMLMAGHNVLKIYWDMARKRVAFDAVPATKIIVPYHTKELQNADRIVHVIELSVEQYKARKQWKQDAEYIEKIRGRGRDGSSGDEQERQEKLIREGLTVASSDDLIVIWEVYSRVGEKWEIETFPPVCPDEPCRNKIGMPYKHGRAPFARCDHEVKEQGHYSSRGLPEIAGAFEVSLCKMWNAKHDYMAFSNRPLFTTTQPIPNGSNIRISPGAVLPHGVSAVEMKAPPVSIDQEMLSTRSIAEYRVGMPDYGLGQAQEVQQAKTATENRQRQALLNQGVDLKARMFRLWIADVYQQAWALLQQYDKDTKFFCEGEWREMSAQAREGEYDIQPNGSSDSWNREARLQKAVARKQLLAGSPWINQGELDKSIIELDDPRLVARLYIDPQEKQGREYEDEAKLIPTVLLGMPLSVRPEQDHVVRIKCLVDFLESRAAGGQDVPPAGVQSLIARITAHLDALHAQNPKLAVQLGKELQHKLEVMQTARQMAGEEAQRMLAAGGGGGPMPAGQPAAASANAVPPVAAPAAA